MWRGLWQFARGLSQLGLDWSLLYAPGRAQREVGVIQG